MNNSQEFETKSEKREKIQKKLAKKGVKHNYGDLGREILKKQELGVSREIKKILKEKTKIKK